MNSFSLPNLDDKICYENVQEKIALNLFECVHWPDNLVEEFCDEIDRFPIEFVTEILNQFRCYYDYTRTDYRVLSRYEDQDKITKMTMIHYLVLFGQEFVLRRLISRYQIDFEIKINMFIDDAIVCELTALWISTFKNLLNITKLLLSYGADANTSNNKGSTPLRLATLNKNVSMMKLLLSYKADPNQSNIYGNSCLMLAAKESNNLEIIELLLDNGADPNHAALCGNTSLHMAALGTNLEAMQLLLKYGAKLTKNHANQTPIHIYAFRKNIDDLDSLDLVISDEDRIVMEEFHASGYLFAKDHRTICSEKIFQHLERAFRLRKQSENSQLLHPKSIEQRPEYEEIIPIRTLEEFQMLKNDPKRLAYECLFAWIRFNGPDSLKTAEGLLMLGARLIDQFGLYVSGLKMWIRAIQIKIKLKVFISHDLFRYFEAIEISLRHNNCDYDEMASFLLEGLEFANDYFHQRPLLNDLEEAINDPKFRLKNRQKFTLNDVKIELQLPPLADFAEKQHSDIDQTIESILILIKFLAKNLEKFNESLQSKFIAKLGVFLRIDYRHSKLGKSLIHMIFESLPQEEMNEVIPILDLLYRSDVNTNVLDYCYNTPLHYLAFYFEKSGITVRSLQKAMKKMLNHTFKSLHTNDPMFHSNYGGLDQVHLDSVNVLNQTAFDINPSLIHCLPPQQFILPLKCLAARIVHWKFLRCGQCKYLSFFPDNHRLQYELTLKELNSKFYDDSLISDLLRIKYELHRDTSQSISCNIFDYSLKTDYSDHNPIEFKTGKILKYIEKLSNTWNINLKILEFIELHGPCKFSHWAENIHDQSVLLKF